MIVTGKNKMSTQRLTDQFKKLVSIDSLSFHERDMADYLKEKMSSLGIELLEDDSAERTGGNCGNLYGCFHGSKDAEPLLFLAHMDTVAPGIGKKAIEHADGTITSDGSTVLGADDASAIAVIIEAIQEIQEEKLPHRDIEILFTTAEEAYTVGASAFDLSKIRAKKAFVLDVSGPVGGYQLTEPTLISFTFTINGKASHAGFEPEEGVNAILAASRAIGRLPIGRPDEHSTFNIGVINGGTATNIVPDKVTVSGEIRSLVHEDALKLLSRAEEIFKDEAEALGAEATVQHKTFLEAYMIADDDPAFLMYKEALDKHHIEPCDRKSFGGSDNNVLRRNGIEGLCIANAMNKIHSCEEYTNIRDLEKVTAIVRELMLN